jgi:hypothetical protein
MTETASVSTSKMRMTTRIHPSTTAAHPRYSHYSSSMGSFSTRQTNSPSSHPAFLFPPIPHQWTAYASTLTETPSPTPNTQPPQLPSSQQYRPISPAILIAAVASGLIVLILIVTCNFWSALRYRGPLRNIVSPRPSRHHSSRYGHGTEDRYAAPSSNSRIDRSELSISGPLILGSHMHLARQSPALEELVITAAPVGSKRGLLENIRSLWGLRRSAVDGGIGADVNREGKGGVYYLILEIELATDSVI